MKKLLAVLLALAMLIPMSLAAPATAEEVEKDPFYALSWADADEKKYPHVDGFMGCSFTVRGTSIVLGGTLVEGSYTDADVTTLANNIKAQAEARPEGMRYLIVGGNGTLFGLTPENALFMDDMVGRMATMMDDLFKKMKEIGCPLDGVAIDTEYVGLYTYYLIDTSNDHQIDNMQDNPDLLRNIVKDKRYKTEIRPYLEEYGFVFYEASDPSKQDVYTELFSLTRNAGSKYSISRQIWDVTMRNHINRYNNQWLYEPLQKYYPDATCSDYQSHDGATWMKMAAADDWGTVLSGGNYIRVGDTATTSFYYTRPGTTDITGLTKVASMNATHYTAEPFTGLLYDVNYFRYLYNSSNNKKVAPYISGYTYIYTGALETRTGGTPYYTDLLYHLAMFAPEPIFSYTWTGDLDNFEGEFDLNINIINQIMVALTDIAGYADREAIEMPMNWNSQYVLTGMYTGGRNLWRITPNNNVISRSDFLIDEETPTFFVNGETITFPGGKILEEASITFPGGEVPDVDSITETNGTEIGSVGYWVETDKDVTPIVTYDENRYEIYPSLEYDFEEYASGVFNYNTSTPTNVWNFKWGTTKAGVKGASNIITVDGNKKLSIIGNSVNSIKTLPSNITAGDSYAEDQAWEITVTIPKGLSKDAQITLLNYEGTRQDLIDGGFMVKDYKLYYASDKNDEEGNPIYEELMEVDTDTTYTFKRLMDFNDRDAFTCTYVVKNKNGRTLKTVENVPVPSFESIETIGFGVAEADKAVSVDDFRIYLTGVTTDFYTYDVKTGREVELNTTRDRSTAYRLSWLNATSEAETAVIKADITEGGKTTTTVIKEVTLTPNTDSVVTGIVNIEEGQTVKVYMETSLKPVAAADAAGPLVDAEFIEGGLEKVPTALKNTELDSLEAIKEALEVELKEKDSTAENVIHYAVKIDKNEIPRDGKMTVIMPYPAGSDANCTFYVSQLHTADAYGKTAGEITTCEAVNTAEGIQFEIFGTSPIAVAWSVPVVVEVTEAPTVTRTPDVLGSPVGTRITRPTEAPEIEETEYVEPTEETEFVEPTEETEYVEPTEAPTETTAPVVVEDEGGVNIVLIIVIAVVVLAGAGAAVFFLLKKKKATPAVAEEIEEIEEVEEPQATEENTEE